MRRRTLLTGGSAILAAPGIVRAENQRTLRFVPGSDLVSVDPVWSTGITPMLHGNTVYDQLFGLDANFHPQPQMLAGVRTDEGGTIWDLTLREGLLFHDNVPVLARDCVASIRRWAKRNPYGNTLMARTDELSAASDTVIRFRLKKPFTALPEALSVQSCVMMPERVAMTDPFKQITDTTGSGPFRFLTDEHVPGASWAYAKFEKYKPRSEGTVSSLAGPRVAHFDRLVWSWLPDQATIAAAMAMGEHDWWENAAFDVLSLLRKNPDLRVEVKNRMGLVGLLRFNHLYKPFNNPAIRRLVLACVNQETFMEAVCGPEPDLYHTKIGLFAPDAPMMNSAGTEALTARTDFAAVKQQLAAAGYDGERVVLMGSSTTPTHHAMAQVADDLMRRMGLNVDFQQMEFGSVLQRYTSKEPLDKGGWSAYIANIIGLPNVFLPANGMIRGGSAAVAGWPDVPRLEALREQWLDAPSLQEEKRIAAELQVQFFQDVTHAPLGHYYAPTCYRKDLADIQPGFSVMNGVRRI